MITSGDLAARIAPALAAAIEARKEIIIDGAQTGPLGRWVLGKVWPRIVGEVPNIAGAAVDAVRQEFGSMTLNDVLDFLGKLPEGHTVALMAPPHERPGFYISDEDDTYGP